MPKVVVRAFACSLDGFGAGLQQSQSEPFGKNAFQIMNWFLPTHTFKSMFGGENGSTGLDDSYAAKAFEGVGASIMGRNMFSPLRGPWADEDWKGWWGDNPPFKHPVFVLTHHPRPNLEFENGTSFHFVNGSPEQVLKQAQAAADGKDVKVNGGVSTVRAFWKARLLDELHLVMAPVFVGEGERLLGGLGVEEDYQVAGFEASEAAVHYRIVKKR
jgi:dihydrofolate reductase